MPAFEKPKSPAGRQGTKAGRARFCLRIDAGDFFMDFWTHPGIRIEIHAYGELGYSHREPLRAGVAAPHPYFQKGIRESAKSKRRESVQAAPKRLRSRSALADSDELRERERASALSAVFSK